MRLFVIGDLLENENDIKEYAKKIGETYKETHWLKKYANKSRTEFIADAFNKVENADIIYAISRVDKSFDDFTLVLMEYSRRLKKDIRIVYM